MSQWKPDPEAGRLDNIGGFAQSEEGEAIEWKGMNLYGPPHLIGEDEFQLLENVRWRGATLAPRGGQVKFHGSVLSADHFLWNAYGTCKNHGGIGGMGMKDFPETAAYKPTPPQPLYLESPLFIVYGDIVRDLSGTSWDIRHLQYFDGAARQRYPAVGSEYPTEDWGSVQGSSLFHRDDTGALGAPYSSLRAWGYYDNYIYLGWEVISNGRKDQNQKFKFYRCARIPLVGTVPSVDTTPTTTATSFPAYEWNITPPADASIFASTVNVVAGGRDGLWVSFCYAEAFSSKYQHKIAKYDPVNNVWTDKFLRYDYPHSGSSTGNGMFVYFKSVTDASYDRIIVVWHGATGGWEAAYTRIPINTVAAGMPNASNEQIPEIINVNGAVSSDSYGYSPPSVKLYKDTGGGHVWPRGDDGGGTSSQYTTAAAMITAGRKPIEGYLGGRIYFALTLTNDYTTFNGMHLFSYGDGESQLRWERALYSTYSRLGAVGKLLGNTSASISFRVCLAGEFGGYLYYLYVSDTGGVGAANTFMLGRFDGVTWDDSYLNLTSELSISTSTAVYAGENGQIRIHGGDLWFSCRAARSSVPATTGRFFAKSNGTLTGTGNWTSTWIVETATTDPSGDSAVAVFSEA